MNLTKVLEEMPKIADIQETPNPNAVKFILKEPVSHGTSHSFDAPEKASDDKLAKSLFDVGDVVSVFYMDKMITVEKTDETDWDEILPNLAVPIRAAESVQAGGNGNGNKSAAAAVGGAIGAALSDNPMIAQINELLDERIRPYLAGDGGWVEITSLENKTLKLRYQGACGSCPSSLTGTLMAIENMIKEEIDPELEVIAE
ncbi:MAG: nitrogen fixation protein NifU [Acidobacteria bacterium]|nr:nitrogen fixation protein NifU [Acidobacteriota bacterium]